MTRPLETVDRTVSINHEGATVPFTFPDSGNMRDHIANILAGREYPLMPLEGYTPDVIVDIGANVGCCAIFFNLFFPSARMLCFEPSPKSFTYLSRNLGGRPNVELFAYGLLDRSESIRLYIGKKQSMQNSILHSFETSDQTELAEVRRASEEWRERGLSHASIVKLDTEGCEVPILQDLRDYFPTIDLLYIEYHSEDDRRAIDAILQESFVLAYCMACAPHRGLVLYTSRSMLERFPVLDAQKISRP